MHSFGVVVVSMIKIVPKVWGEERWIVNNDLYCGKILVLNKGAQCSFHMHPKKHETFHVIGGCVQMHIEGMTKLLKSGDTVTIPPNTLHSFFGLTYSEIFEISTPHDDNDVVRFSQSTAASENPYKEGEVIVRDDGEQTWDNAHN